MDFFAVHNISSFFTVHNEKKMTVISNLKCRITAVIEAPE